MRQILRSIPLLLLVFFCGCANGLFYHPNQRLYQHPKPPFEAVTFKSDDGTKLSGWFFPAKGTPLGTVLHFHGNAANISNHYGFVKWLPEEGFNLFMFDYRGYGDSEGRPNRAGLHKDSVAALTYVASRNDVEKIVVLGQSLGGANAVDAVVSAPHAQVVGVAIDSAFYSYRRIAKDKAGLIPVLGWFKTPLSFLLVTNGHSPGPLMKELSVPVLIIHGTQDRIIPFDHGRALYNAAEEPKEFWAVPQGFHTSALLQKEGPWREKLVHRFKTWLGATHKPRPQGHRPPAP